MQKKTLSPLAILWICNILLFFVHTIGTPSLSFLKSSVLEYNNVISDPFDGASSPIAYVPDWSRAENMNKARLFESFSVADFIEIPEYKIDVLEDTGDKSKTATIMRYTYPVVYMGSYRGNYTEYDGSHGAIDIRAPIGTPVLSVANGVVVKVKNLETGDGKYVTVRHDNIDINGTKETLYSTYEHLSEIIAIEGTKIRRGEVLGKVGMTGITTTPHVHFQIDKSSAPFHAYWPYTFKEAADLGLDFFGAINVGLGKENMIRYTINPMEFIKDNPVLASAPKDPDENNSSKTSIVTSTELVADITPPNTIIPTPAPTDVKDPIETKTETSTPIKPIFVPSGNRFFSDIQEDSPFYEATKYLFNTNVVRGYDDGGFHPNDLISRGETILLYDRLFKMQGAGEEIILPFRDVLPSDEIYPTIIKAFAQKIISRGPLFRPNDSLTRAEAITLLVRSSGLIIDTDKQSIFSDVKVKSSHMPYINTFAKYLNIRSGNFSPDTNITRGELAKILYTFDQKKQKESN